jgi:diguanylate cyclase (GGDEF)-like protein
VGDALLKAVAGRLRTIAGEGDLVVRMGGDEFILVQKSPPGRDDAELTAQRIFQSVSAPYRIDGHDITIGVSIGVAISPDDGQSVDGLLSRSDRALYRAKERRGGYVFALDLPQVSSPGLAPAAEAVAASTGQWAA